jgi:hypothetical protein
VDDLIPIPNEVWWKLSRHLLSPTLSSILNEGEGARRVGEEALIGEATGFHSEIV